MYISRFFGIFTIVMALAACSSKPESRWAGAYSSATNDAPRTMQYGMYTNDGAAKRMAVLLPATGTNAATGHAIRSAIEIAVLEAAPQNLSVAFYDTAADTDMAIATMLATNPEVVVGPLFADDARAVRAAKGDALPVLTFTSDATAVGNGVMTMALMPTNSSESAVAEIARDGNTNFVIIAPDTTHGRIMAAAAIRAAEYRNITPMALFYYVAGDTESIKTVAADAALNTARVAANTRAKTVLSDILTNESLATAEKSSISRQLEKLAKNDTLGPAPYGAVLMLGSADDSKTLGSFLRYYGVDAGNARFYGTAMWDGTDIASDFTMAGAKFATLTPAADGFSTLYQQLTGKEPSHMAAMGYDAANMAMGMIYSGVSPQSYLLNPSGYIGADGLFRLRPNGTSERAMRIVQTDGHGGLNTVRNAPSDFITPIYSVVPGTVRNAPAFNNMDTNINIYEYVSIPERMRAKYNFRPSKRASTTPDATYSNVVTVIESDGEDAISDPEFQPMKLESVRRTLIDSVEIEE